MKKLLTLTLLLLVLAIALTACGNDPVTSESTTASTTVTTTSSATTSTPASTTAQGPSSTAVVTTVQPATSTAVTTSAPVTTAAPSILDTAYDEPEKFVTLPALSEITVSGAEINKEYQAYMAELILNMGKADLTPLDAGVAAIKGDAVNIHYTGRAKDPSVTLSEETLAGMTNASKEGGYDLILGSNSFIPGFEDQLIGAKKGDTVTVDVTFPDDYSEELSGVAVLFECTVNEVKRAKIDDKNIVSLTVSYALNEAEPNGDIATFLKEHTSSINMATLTEAFDDYFDSALIAVALMDKGMFETVTLPLTLSAEQAAEFGYESALSLTATVTVDLILISPDELTDADVDTFSGGAYKTVKDLTDYIYGYYRTNAAYIKILEIIEFSEIPADVYKELYNIYYQTALEDQLGDISDLTEQELAEKLTEEIKTEADEFAKENATAEWEDRMMMAYLTKVTNYTLSDETYQSKLKAFYEQNAMMFYYYYGITSVEVMEQAFGKDYFVFQFTNEAVLELVGQQVTVVN